MAAPALLGRSFIHRQRRAMTFVQFLSSTDSRPSGEEYAGKELERAQGKV